MTGRWLSRLGVALVVVVLVGSITAMPIAATDRPAVSTPTPAASTHAPAAALTTPLSVADGTAVTPLSTTSEITITVTDSANGQDTATTPITVEQDTTLDTLNVDLAPSTVTATEETDVTVTVTNQSNGEPVDGASVDISDLGLSGTTDADGEVTFSVNESVADDYAVEVSADGYTDITPDMGVNLTVEDDADTTPGDVPQQLAEEDVSAASYSAVVGDDSQLGAGNLAGAIQSWAGDDGSEQGFVGETNVGAGELSSMINYWSSEIAG
jgi:hypothetical protein